MANRHILHPIKPLIPLSKPPQPIPEAGRRFKSVISLKGAGIGVSDRYVAGLHGNQFFMRVEVIIRRKDPGADQLFLEDGHEVQQVFRVIVSDIIYGVRRDRKAVLAGFLLGRALHDTLYAFHDIVDVGEVTSAVAVIKDLYGLAVQQLVGKAKVSHIRSAGGAVHGEEAQAG